MKMIDFSFNFWSRPNAAKELFTDAGIKAAQKAAEYVAQQARQYAPVDTGDLLKSIKVQPSMGGMVWNVLVLVPYAGYVEYGTLHGDVWIPPNPFFRKAMDDGKKRFPDILRESMTTTPYQLTQGMKLGTTIRVTG
jgi:HK97 gp10 family phage protein